MSKRLVICSDGTWNTPDQKDRGKYRPSNVVKIARAVASVSRDGKIQIVFYDKGVGTGWGLEGLVTSMTSISKPVTVEPALEGPTTVMDKGTS